MKAGQIVLHVKTGILLRIVELRETTALCSYADKPEGWKEITQNVCLNSLTMVTA
jgi:hypothetical protein